MHVSSLQIVDIAEEAGLEYWETIAVNEAFSNTSDILAMKANWL